MVVHILAGIFLAIVILLEFSFWVISSKLYTPIISFYFIFVNTKLVHMGRGVCGAIFRKAGILKLRSACRKIKRPIELGQAVITPAFNLPSKYIIHTASKRYIDGKHNETEILKQCYRNSIKLAVEYGCKDITFPIIGGGMYGFNINEAREIAFDTIGEYLYENKLDIKVWVIDYVKIKKMTKAEQRKLDKFIKEYDERQKDFINKAKQNYL
jgi:O-acetyl-ADP-ribose deacetylase (regulator of RNase III)